MLVDISCCVSCASVFLLLLSCCFVGAVVLYAIQNTEDDDPQLDALLDFYVSLNGPNWINKAGWNTSDDYCTWFGVQCADGSAISEMYVVVHFVVSVSLFAGTHISCLLLSWVTLTEL